MISRASLLPTEQRFVSDESRLDLSSCSAVRSQLDAA